MVLVWVRGSHSESHCFTEQEKVRCCSSSKLKVQPNFRVQLISSERPLKKDFPFLSVVYTFLYPPLSSSFCAGLAICWLVSLGLCDGSVCLSPSQVRHGILPTALHPLREGYQDEGPAQK